MAATKHLSQSFGLNSRRTNGIVPVKASSGLLIDTMQLVAPREKIHVPNHLLESKLYSKIAQNGIIEARPSVIHFTGFELGKTQKISLKIGNMDTEVIRMHIIPPQTKYFDIKYTKGERLVPGLTLDCTVEFTSDEWRYYYDCIRIHSKGNDNLIIPIHAYPVMDISEFPSLLNFPVVPVGKRVTRDIPLRCSIPIDFEYSLNIVQPHPAFNVEPLAGVVPANGETKITVSFLPSEFLTARMQMQLNVSQFCSKPVLCTCTGTSAPGLEKERSAGTVKMLLTEKDRVLDPHCISPIDRARKKRKEKIAKDKTTFDFSSNEIEKDGIRFPKNLDTPYAVASVLNQKAGKLRMKDLQEAIAAKKETEIEGRQLKETVFEQSIRKSVYDERQNQLRWQVKLGDDPITDETRRDVLLDREAAWNEYRRKRGDPIRNEEYNRYSLKKTFRRTIRDSDELPATEASFDTFVNDPWRVRQAALDRFAQAARTILVRLRADKKIKGLRTMVLDWGKKSIQESPGAEEEEEQSEEVGNPLIETLDSSKVKHFKFPTYTPPDVKDDMAPDALDSVPIEATEVVIPKKVPFSQLKVPQLYKLSGYSSHGVHSASGGYVPPKLSRRLRVGAEDEVITLADSSLDQPVEVYERSTSDLDLDYILKDSTSAESVIDLSLKPPKTLFKPIEYPPLHIFNPTPGLQVFQAPLPYAEVDPDFQLCPLPKYPIKDPDSNPHNVTQKKFLDREDTIKGVMTWKKFPSQGLTSLANTPTLTNVWAPRWTDPFSSDLLPHNVPDLYGGLSEEDREHVKDEEEEEETPLVALTPEMVNAQFSLIDPSHVATDEKQTGDLFPHGSKMPATNIPVSATGPVPREKREQELDYFLNKKYNKLGSKIQSRVDSMDNITVKKDLVLE